MQPNQRALSAQHFLTEAEELAFLVDRFGDACWAALRLQVREEGPREALRPALR
jgi:hypothetical protein